MIMACFLKKKKPGYLHILNFANIIFFPCGDLVLGRGRNFVRFCQIFAKEGRNAAFEERSAV